MERRFIIRRFLFDKIKFFLARKEEIADFFAASSPPHSAFLSMTVSCIFI
jgi:hypothetical protein